MGRVLIFGGSKLRKRSIEQRKLASSIITGVISGVYGVLLGID